MKRFSVALTLAVALAGLAPGGLALSNTAPSALPGTAAPFVFLDGLPLQFAQPAHIEGGTTWVPRQPLAEALGGCGPAVPAAELDGTVMVPLRTFSAACGATVTWEAESRTVRIASPVRSMRTLAFYAIRSYSERTFVPAFSDVAYGWATLTADGQVDLTGGEYRWPEPDGDVTGERLLAEAAAASTRRHLMVQAVDGQVDLAGLVQDPEWVGRAAAAIAAAVSDKGFDGVVLDLEGLGHRALPEEEKSRIREGFLLLVRRVAEQLQPAGKETIVSVPPLNGWYEGYDYARLAEAAGLLQVMAYDYRQDGGPEPWELVDEAIRLAVEQVGEGRRQQLLLGMVSAYETPETLWQKAGLAKRYGLGGLSVWRLGEVGAERLQALESTVSPLKRD